FVMGAGLIVTLIGYRLVFGRGRPLWSPRFNLPTSTAIDAPLISGAVIFGVGWGLAGYCPGPALVSLASGRMEVFVFVIAMDAGESGGSTNGIRAELNVVKRTTSCFNSATPRVPRRVTEMRPINEPFVRDLKAATARTLGLKLHVLHASTGGNLCTSSGHRS